jgi:hypothetical protein
VGFCDGQKWRWGRFSPRTLVSPANLHSICFSTIIFTIIRGWHNRPGVAAVPIASQNQNQKNPHIHASASLVFSLTSEPKYLYEIFLYWSRATYKVHPILRVLYQLWEFCARTSCPIFTAKGHAKKQGRNKKRVGLCFVLLFVGWLILRPSTSWRQNCCSTICRLCTRA